MSVFTKILRVGEGKDLKRFKQLATYISSLDEEYQKLTDEELKAKTPEFKKRLEEGETVDDLIVEAFAVAREASFRVLHQKHYLVQIMGGLALHYGNVAEMKTGEGKTLTCVLPAYLNALAGKGVHVVTVNDYLAERDAEQMGRVHRFLGLSVGVVLSDDENESRKVAYNSDITYGTNNQFGFDYLRDNMVHDVEDLVQNGQHYAIVDEVDSILIDEARTPLIISGPAGDSSKWYPEFANIAEKMEKDLHYEVDYEKRTIGIHEEGVAFVEDQLGIDNLYEAVNSALVAYLNNAVKAKELFLKDKEYIIEDGKIVLIDEFTGRLKRGSQYSEGLHQSIEAKEKVEINEETVTYATITLQNYFRLYKKLSGMTGTASAEAAELKQIYKLGVTTIPTNRPTIRKDYVDSIFASEEAKFNAVLKDIAERHAKGQPILVGTTSVEKSEYLSKLLKKAKIKHTVLNAKNNEKEGNIISEAGLINAVTVATNMAGRGTDIVLGGTVDVILGNKLKNMGLDPVTTPTEYQKQWDKHLESVEKEKEIIGKQVRELGGLYVIGTERHESRRIDDQLRGRSGRQGDPGESKFYVSLQDDMIKHNLSGMYMNLMGNLIDSDEALEMKRISNAIKSVQTTVENRNFERRKDVLKYDEVLNRQRTVVYQERNKILHGDDFKDEIQDMMREVIRAYVDGATAEGFVEEWDFDELWNALSSIYPIGISYKGIILDEKGNFIDITPGELYEIIIADAEKAYKEREEELELKLGENGMRKVERNILLSVLDNKWRDHLYEIGELERGIGLRAAAQKDPIVEYQREGHDMFLAMLDSIKESTVENIFNAQIQVYQDNPDIVEMPREQTNEERVMSQAFKTVQGILNGMSLEEAQDMIYTGPDENGDVQSSRDIERTAIKSTKKSKQKPKSKKKKKK